MISRRDKTGRKDMLNPSFKISLNSQISHELRIPVSVIIGFLHFLQETPLNREQKNYIHEIEISANQILQAQEKISQWLHKIKIQ
jgi:signal transduction histidine kinase